MPALVPFRALRPTKETVAKFSAKTSDFKNQEEVLADMRQNPETYYYVTKQNLIAEEKQSIEHSFSKGALFIKQKIQDKDLFQDFTPSYYVYRQIDHLSGRTYTGIIGLADVLDLEKNSIKKHELTKAVREEYLYKQLHFTEVLGEPVLLGYEYSAELHRILSCATLKMPEYHFNSIDKKEHLIWLINSSKELEEVSDGFNSIQAFYIADGHHRCASTLRNYHKNPSSNNRFFMVFLLDETQFHIESFHRSIKGLMPEQLLNIKEKINAYFDVENYKDGQLYKPDKHGRFGLLTRTESLILTLKKEPRTANPEAHLDVIILEKKILSPFFDILHPRSDQRLGYLTAKDDDATLLNLLKRGSIDIVISNYAITFDEVKKVANAQKTMPPKSTYIEPKLRGGMVIQKY